jgi:hypothetical protein
VEDVSTAGMGMARSFHVESRSVDPLHMVKPARRPAPGRRDATPRYMTGNVSDTTTAAPPARTGQPFASATAASRLSALRIE